MGELVELVGAFGTVQTVERQLMRSALAWFTDHDEEIGWLCARRSPFGLFCRTASRQVRRMAPRYLGRPKAARSSPR